MPYINPVFSLLCVLYVSKWENTPTFYTFLKAWLTNNKLRRRDILFYFILKMLHLYGFECKNMSCALKVEANDYKAVLNLYGDHILICLTFIQIWVSYIQFQT